jgi:hypothetical protein
MIEIQKRITSAQKTGLFFFTIMPVFFFGILVLLPFDEGTIQSRIEQIQIIGGAVLILWLGIAFCLAAINSAVFLLEKNKTALLLTDEGLYNCCSIFTKNRLMKWSDIGYLELHRDEKSSLFSIIINGKNTDTQLIPNWLRILLFPFEILNQKALTIPCDYLDIERKQLLDILRKYARVDSRQDVREPSPVTPNYDMLSIRPQKTVAVEHSKILLWVVFIIIFALEILFLWCSFEFYKTNIGLTIIFGIIFSFLGIMFYYTSKTVFGNTSKIPALLLSNNGVQINNLVNDVVVMPWTDVHCANIVFDANSFTHILTIVPEDPEKYKQYNASFLQKMLSGQQQPGHFNFSVMTLSIKINDLTALLQEYTVVK